MEVSFRPALTFPHTPARSPLAPESSREPNPAPSPSPSPISPPFLLPRRHQPLRLYIERPPRPDPLRKLRANVLSSYHPARRPQLPEQPPWPPSTLCLHSFPLPPLAASLPQGAAADTLATTYTPRISALGIPSASCARVRMRFIVDVKGASFQHACTCVRV